MAHAVNPTRALKWARLQVRCMQQQDTRSKHINVGKPRRLADSNTSSTGTLSMAYNFFLSATSLPAAC
jgi:hypothetical protein